MLIGLQCWGQGQDSQWYFGNQCWLDFSSGEAIDQGSGPFNANEGSASIADKSGQVLFSTDCTKIYDRNGVVMPNGSALGGHSSSSQGALIVPQPGDKEERFYYVFTVAAEAGNYDPAHTGLEYVLVDMGLRNGLGDVISAPIELVANTGEKLHAAWHSNRQDVWVVTHTMDSQDYHAFLLTCDGITEHVISSTGRVHAKTSYGEGCIGALKISPDGNRIASSYNGIGNSALELTHYLETGYFNAATGEIEITDESNVDAEFAQAYGVEFSPDGSKVYWAIMGGELFLYQYDLQANSLDEGKYQFMLGNPQGHALSALQLAPNGKIYIARTHNGTYLSAIGSPNAPEADASYIEEAVVLSRPSRFGLPNQWMYPYPNVEYEVEEIGIEACQGDLVQLDAPADIPEPYIWSNGQTSSTIHTRDSDEYWVTAQACSWDTTFFNFSEPDFCACELYVPNSFTPNADGVNDSFGPVLWCDVEDFRFEVYDRWGQLVFQSDHISLRWDGSYNGYYLADGIYTWKVEWKEFQSGQAEFKREFGSLSLLK